MGKYSLAHRVCFFVTIIIKTDDKANSSLWCQKCEFQRCCAVDDPKSCNGLGLHSAGWLSLLTLLSLPRNSKGLLYSLAR